MGLCVENIKSNICNYNLFFPSQAIFVVIILGWLFVPIYIKAGVCLHFFLFNQHYRTNLSNIAYLHNMNVYFISVV